MTKRIDEIGSVGLQRVLHKRRRTVGDPLSVGRVTTKHQASKGFRTEGERETVALKLKQQKQKGLMGGGATAAIKKRRMGIADNTNTYQRVCSMLLEAARSNPQLDYILKSKEKVMSGVTRAYRRGARKVRDSAPGSEGSNRGEDLINQVPKKFSSMLRRARRARARTGRKRVPNIASSVNKALRGKK